MLFCEEVSEMAKEPYSEIEVERRREEALKRMLSTPHKPHTPVKGRKAKSSQDRKSNPKKKPA